MKIYLALSLILFLLGCSTLDDESEASIEACPILITTRNVLSFSHDELICNGNKLEVVCEYKYGIDEEDWAICKGYTDTIVTYLNRNVLMEGYLLNATEVDYTQEGVCFDTFIPGRESADCYDYIKITIPIVK